MASRTTLSRRTAARRPLRSPSHTSKANPPPASPVHKRLREWALNPSRRSHPLHAPPSLDHDASCKPTSHPLFAQPVHKPNPCFPSVSPLSAPSRFTIPLHPLTSGAARAASTGPRRRLQGDCNCGAVRLAVALASAAPAVASQVEVVIDVDCAHALGSLIYSPDERPGGQGRAAG